MNLQNLFDSQFTNLQICLFGCAICLGIAGVVGFQKGMYKYSVFFLFLSGLIIRLAVSTLDPFLWTWDEQFHALVAKNMVSNPFKPMLLADPVLDYDFRNWQENHIWLHKQPLFLWQIALFFKVFGTNEFVLRLPTVLMMSAMIPLIFRIGKLTSNPETGWYGAFIYTYSFYFIQFVSGYKFTDHNDSAFIFYVTLSIWAWVEYNGGKHTTRWLILIGLFAGMAILNKWVVGLLVYSGWLLSILLTHPQKEWLHELKKPAVSLLFTMLVVLPWQLYIFFAFPVESHYEFLYNSRHFFEPLEGHGETWYYHFFLLSEQYGGNIVYFIILPGLFLYFRSILIKSYRVAMITYLVATYLFFTIAATKTPMFCAIVSPVIFLGLGATLSMVISIVRKIVPARAFLLFLVVSLGLLAYVTMDLRRLDSWHSDELSSWRTLRINAIIDKHVAGKLQQDEKVVFNCAGNNPVMFMFYTGRTAYRRYPVKKEYLALKSRGIRMATFADENLPGFLRGDPSVRKINLKQLYY